MTLCSVMKNCGWLLRHRSFYLLKKNFWLFNLGNLCCKDSLLFLFSQTISCGPFCVCCVDYRLSNMDQMHFSSENNVLQVRICCIMNFESWDMFLAYIVWQQFSYFYDAAESTISPNWAVLSLLCGSGNVFTRFVVLNCWMRYSHRLWLSGYIVLFDIC